MSEKPYRFETLALHAGQTPDATLSRGVPVYRTSSYVFKNTEHAANLFALKELGNIYTRLMNPTTDMLEQRVSQLEGGAASVALASGTSAIFYAIITLAQAGDEIVSANNLYGGTYTQFDAILPQFGIKVNFVDAKDPKNFARGHHRQDPRHLHRDHRQPGAGLHRRRRGRRGGPQHGLPLDRGRHLHHALPAAHHRARRGHRGELAHQVAGRPRRGHRRHHHRRGAVPVEEQSALPAVQPSPTAITTACAGPTTCPSALAPIAFALRVRTVPLRNLGAAISPDNSFLFLQGIETLPVRMARHCENALTVAAAPQAAPEGGVGALSRPQGRPDLRPGQQVPQERLRRHGGVRRSRAAIRRR